MKRRKGAGKGSGELWRGCQQAQNRCSKSISMVRTPGARCGAGCRGCAPGAGAGAGAGDAHAQLGLPEVRVPKGITMYGSIGYGL